MGRNTKYEDNKPDVCHYCGKEYHPMGVFTKGHVKRWVCQWNFVQEPGGGFKIEVVDECVNLASAEGFKFNKKLTPRR